MSEEPFYPIKTAEEMIAGFTNCTLPLDEWDHGTHLVAGLFVLAKYGDAAYSVMKTRLLNYTTHHGKDGYHETMTRFWIWAVQYFMEKENGSIAWNQEQLDAIIFNEELTRRNLWNDYYSLELMQSGEAKKNFVSPDLKEME